MTIVFGFRTPAALEVPVVLYIGDDGTEAARIAEESDYPRVASVKNPQLIATRHWSEAASTTFEQAHGAELGPPHITDPVGEFTVEEAPKPAEPDSDLEVSGAGSSACNGAYTNQDPDTWNGPLGVCVLKRITDYPTPGAKSWAICQDANVHYVAPDVPSPWDAVWAVSSFGTAPIPTVTASPSERVQKGKKTDAEATKTEEAAEQKFLAKQAGRK